MDRNNKNIFKIYTNAQWEITTYNMATSCTYCLPTIISQLLKNSHTTNIKKPSTNTGHLPGPKKKKWLGGGGCGGNGQNKRATGLGRKTRENNYENGESKESPEIPDNRETSDIPGLPPGSTTRHSVNHICASTAYFFHRSTSHSIHADIHAYSC